jgi:hypothetical protein
MDRPPLPPFTLETATQKVRMAEDAWNSRDPQRVALAYTIDSRLAQSIGVPAGPRGHRSLPDAQVAQGARLPTDQGNLGLPRKPNRRALRVRVARRQRQLVSQLRQRELGIRRPRPDAIAIREHQRPADLRVRAPLPLAAGQASG